MTDKPLGAWLEKPRQDNRGRLHYRASWHERQPDGTLRRHRQSLWSLGVRTQEQAEAWVARKTALLNNTPEGLPNVTAREAFDEYLADLQFRTTRRTWQETGTLVARFLALTGAGPRPLLEITKGVIRSYLDSRLAGTHRGYGPVAPATRDSELRILRAAFRRLAAPPFEFSTDPTVGILPLAPPVRPKDGGAGLLRRCVRRLGRWARGLVRGRKDDP